ncbi:MAG: formyltransferase family protein [Acidimicrobiales bacterium]
MPIWASWSRSAGSSSRTCSKHCRWSTSTSRCCLAERSAAPVERALLAGDTETGVCVMQVAEGLDTGEVYRRAIVTIDDTATLDSLRGELVDIGTDLLVASLRDGLGPGEPQIGEPVYAEKIANEEYRIDPTRSSESLHRLVRLGGAWGEFRGKRFKIWAVTPSTRDDLAPGQLDGTLVGTGTTALELVEVQPEGKARMDARSWINGAQPSPDERLS